MILVRKLWYFFNTRVVSSFTIKVLKSDSFFTIFGVVLSLALPIVGYLWKYGLQNDAVLFSVIVVVWIYAMLWLVYMFRFVEAALALKPGYSALADDINIAQEQEQLKQYALEHLKFQLRRHIKANLTKVNTVSDAKHVMRAVLPLAKVYGLTLEELNHIVSGVWNSSYDPDTQNVWLDITEGKYITYFWVNIHDNTDSVWELATL